MSVLSVLNLGANLSLGVLRKFVLIKLKRVLTFWTRLSALNKMLSGQPRLVDDLEIVF